MKRKTRPRHGLLMLALAVVVVACGGSGDADQVARLEAENAELRRQIAELEAAAPTTTTDVIIPRAGSTTADVPDPTTTTTSAQAISGTSPRIEVLSITDGDTLRLLIDGVNEPVRLIGTNAPEGGECLAAEAARRLGELVASGSITIRGDQTDRDQFDRLLRYVYADDLFVNETLVAEGVALAVRYEPDVAESDRLEAAQASAESRGVGMWDPTACGAASSGTIEIGEVHYDAAGNDNHNLNDEWVELINPGDIAIDLTGWSVKDESATHRYRFPGGFSLAEGQTVRLHSGCGEDTTTSLYWCNQGSAVWNNSGDTVFLIDPNGNVVVSASYTGG